MQKYIEIKEVIQKENHYIFIANESNIDVDNVTASGQMLVDSDSLAFIYKLETETEFIYVRLNNDVWSILKQVIDENLKVILILNGKEIELIHIIDELQYLIHNIEGNANYGEKLVSSVEEIFLGK